MTKSKKIFIGNKKKNDQKQKTKQVKIKPQKPMILTEGYIPDSSAYDFNKK